MPERLVGLSVGQLAVLRQLASGDMRLAEMDIEDSVHLAVLQNRGLTEADKDGMGRVVVRLTVDGRGLIEAGLAQ